MSTAAYMSLLRKKKKYLPHRHIPTSEDMNLYIPCSPELQIGVDIRQILFLHVNLCCGYSLEASQ